jgi:hypothetical protein
MFNYAVPGMLLVCPIPGTQGLEGFDAVPGIGRMCPIPGIQGLEGVHGSSSTSTTRDSLQCLTMLSLE